MKSATRHPWLWPVAIVALFLLLFVGSVWLARVAHQVGEVPIDTAAEPAARGGSGP
jgi:H+/Cl- antiporter ClcA